MPSGPRTLVLDIETAPMRVYGWRLWKENHGIDQIEEDWYIMGWDAKWLGERKMFHAYLPDFPKHYDDHPEDDSLILKPLWNLLEEADIVVTHNGDRFDIPKIKSRMVYHGMEPFDPPKSVDTCKIARHEFGFSSNKLDFIGRHLGLGKKVDTGGFKLWKSCLEGDLKAWKKMERYCAQDVRLLEKVYLRLRPWQKTHPVYGLYTEDTGLVCHKCGCADLKPKGWSYTAAGKYRRYRCLECGARTGDRKNVLPKEKRSTLTKNVVG